jgi:hypothetical protein
MMEGFPIIVKLRFTETECPYDFKPGNIVKFKGSRMRVVGFEAFNASAPCQQGVWIMDQANKLQFVLDPSLLTRIQ